MKMNRFALADSETAHLAFIGTLKETDYAAEILVSEHEPQVIIKQNKVMILSETVKSIADLKNFFEE